MIKSFPSTDVKRLLGVLGTALILTIMLGSMVWSRVSLLQNGEQIILKTRPVDPRDFLRGYYVRLNYDISRIAPADLVTTTKQKKLHRAFKRHSPIFVKLRRDEEGFWSPLSLHHTRSEVKTDRRDGPHDIVMRGRVLYGNCHRRSKMPLGALLTMPKCKISVRYGIEKFFVKKSKARQLEDFSRQTTPEMDEIDQQLKRLNNEFTRKLRQLRTQNRGTDRRQAIRILSKQPEITKIRERLTKLRQKRQTLREQNNKAMAKRFAVIVRVDKATGETAISGLQLDGQQIYEEPLF